MRILLTLFFFLSLALSAIAGNQQTPKRKGSIPFRANFTDSVKMQINPSDRDAGKELSQHAEAILATTLDDIYFWATTSSLGVSVLLAFTLAHFLQQRQRREILTATLLSWYHNRLVCALRDKSEQSIEKEAPAQTLRAAVSATPSDPNPSMTTTEVGTIAGSSSPGMLEELTRLRQALNTRDNSEAVLRGQINSLTRRLNEEKQKNKSLK